MKLKKNTAIKAITNLALCALIVSVGVVCLYPVDSTVSKEGEANIYRCASGNSDGVSLMFNVYWGTEQVYQILDILKENQAKATFFIGGSWADDNVECLKQIAADGHEIGNHGYFHKDHAKLSRIDNEKEIKACNQFISLSIGKTPTLFAPPSGSYAKEMLSACDKLNMVTILWSRDTIDWRDKDSALIYKRATKDIKGGEFVLMHPMQETVNALNDVLKYFTVEKRYNYIPQAETISYEEFINLYDIELVNSYEDKYYRVYDLIYTSKETGLSWPLRLSLRPLFDGTKIGAETRVKFNSTASCLSKKSLTFLIATSVSLSVNIDL
jgi:peptidoglycan/xylan/chitin deacetylase (PgdA/CDA1 family)